MFYKLEEMVKEYNSNYGNEGGSAFLQQYERNFVGDTGKLSNDCDNDTPLIRHKHTPYYGNRVSLFFVTVQQAWIIITAQQVLPVDNGSSSKEV